MTAPSLDALRDVLRNAPNPADVLPQLWEMAARRLLPLEQVLELAASPDLAGSATPASCQRLVEALQGVAEEVGEARMLASILDLHAAALVECARYREALILYDAVLPFLHRYAPPTVVGICLMNCALALQHLGRLAEAVASYDAGLPLLPAHEYTLAAQCLLWRAIALGKLGRHAEALAGYNAALPLLQAHDPSNVTPCLLYRAITLGKLGRQAEAVASIDPLLRQHHASQSSCRDSYTPPIRVASASDLEEEMDHYFEAQGRQVEAES
jgi:tetratricopeptide (TPR) repeat protein